MPIRVRTASPAMPATIPPTIADVWGLLAPLSSVGTILLDADAELSDEKELVASLKGKAVFPKTVGELSDKIRLVEEAPKFAGVEEGWAELDFGVLLA